MVEIPVTASDLDYDFSANTSPPPGNHRRGVVSDSAYTDPGHIMTAEEWEFVKAQAEGQKK